MMQEKRWGGGGGQFRNDCNVSQHFLFIVQNEKCHLLIEHETEKLKELDEEHSQEIKEWREKLRPRKKVITSLHNLTKKRELFYYIIK